MYRYIDIGKVVKSSENDSIVVIGASVTVHEAIKAQSRLKDEGIHILMQESISASSISFHLSLLIKKGSRKILRK